MNIEAEGQLLEFLEEHRARLRSLDEARTKIREGKLNSGRVRRIYAASVRTKAVARIRRDRIMRLHEIIDDNRAIISWYDKYVIIQ